MKELAIYGDSFASKDAPNGWSYLLQQSNPTEIDIFAEQGSSIDWSFDLFLKTHSNYKNIIFVVTTVGRIHFPVKCKNKKDGSISIIEHWCGIDQIEWVLDNYTTENNILENSWKFLTEVGHHNYPYKKNIHIAITNYIKHLRPDAIVVPALRQESIGDQANKDLDLEYSNWSLHDISIKETSGFDKKLKWTNMHDVRCNHLTKESNQWVLKHIEARLAGKFIDWDPSTTPAFKDIKSLKEAS